MEETESQHFLTEGLDLLILGKQSIVHTSSKSFD